MKLGLINLSAIAVAAMLTTGCANNRVHKGAVIDRELASTIQPGIDNKDSVRKILGGPTFIGEFTPNDWYYLSRDTNQFAFRNPRPIKQSVLRIRFDQAGNVASIDHSGKELVVNLDPTKRATPTLGRKRSFLDELFGGIGSVNSIGAPTQAPPGQ
jgi:outer membrane protein assembly factor BamE (lipoprotein component of BamABCDE complex)